MPRLTEMCRLFWGAKVQFLFVEEWSVLSSIFFFFFKKENEVNNYIQKEDMGCVPLLWAPERSLNWTPTVAVTLQLLRHTWERIGRTSGTAPCQTQSCCTVLSALFVLTQRNDWICYFSSHTRSKDMYLPIMTVFCKVVEHDIGTITVCSVKWHYRFMPQTE